MTTDELTTTQPDADAYRIEHDTMGEVRVPRDALYQAQTQRAIENFPISGTPIEPAVVHALGRIKGAAARANSQLGVVKPEIAERIAPPPPRSPTGSHDDEFPLDVFQTGSGTSSNMNANEVIATLASRDGTRIHPNDDVNASQSSNDVFPTAVHLATTAALVQELVPALDHLAESLERKADEFADIVKAGRTHLMDATPVTLGQEFGGYAAQVRYSAERLEAVLPRVAELPLGGTAVGTGINTPPGFAEKVIGVLIDETGLPLREARNHFEAQGSRDALVEASGAAEDRGGQPLQDLQRPALDGFGTACGARRDPHPRPAARVLDHARQGQPGHLRGDDDGVRPGHRQRRRRDLLRHGGELRAQRDDARHGPQRHRVDPVAHQRLAPPRRPLRRRHQARESHMRHLAESSPSIVTPLNRYIGYENAAAVAKKALKEGRTIRDVVIDEGYLDSGHLTEEQLDDALDVMAMTRRPE